MLPEHLVPSRFHLSTSPTNTDTVENSENLTQGKTTLSEFEADILISATATGQTRNMLFEECDRHLKERLFRAAKSNRSPVCLIHCKQKVTLTHKN